MFSFLDWEGNKGHTLQCHFNNSDGIQQDAMRYFYYGLLEYLVLSLPVSQPRDLVCNWRYLILAKCEVISASNEPCGVTV